MRCEVSRHYDWLDATALPVRDLLILGKFPQRQLPSSK